MLATRWALTDHYWLGNYIKLFSLIVPHCIGQYKMVSMGCPVCLVSEGLMVHHTLISLPLHLLICSFIPKLGWLPRRHVFTYYFSNFGTPITD